MNLPLLIILLTCDRSDGFIPFGVRRRESCRIILHSLWGYEGPTKITTLQSQAMQNFAQFSS